MYFISSAWREMLHRPFAHYAYALLAAGAQWELIMRLSEY